MTTTNKLISFHDMLDITKLLGNADEFGNVTIRTYRDWMAKEENNLSIRTRLNYLEQLFMDDRMFISFMHNSSDKPISKRNLSILNDSQLTIDFISDKICHCTINIHSLLKLPSLKSISDELSELKQFFDLIKKTYEYYPELQYAFQVYKTKSINNIVIAMDVTNGKDLATNKNFDIENDPRGVLILETKHKLNEMIQSIPTITHYANTVRKNLAYLGVHSWWSISETSLFPHSETPNMNFMMNKLEQDSKVKNSTLTPTTP